MPVDLSHLARVQLLDQDPRITWEEMRRTIERAIDNQPRSLQKRIGPSELGTPCSACLIEKLAGHQERRQPGMDWLPFVGSAVHEQLAVVFAAANEGLPRARYLVEAKVSVGEIGGEDITGHADLYDGLLGEVTDYKIVGDTTLRKAKGQGHPGPTYRTQAHLYGRGFVRRGLPVKRVRVAFLPRNAKHLRNAYVWDEPYDESVALKAIERADMLARAIQAFGFDAVIKSTRHTGDEFSCDRYDTDSPAEAGRGDRSGHRTTESLLSIA